MYPRSWREYLLWTGKKDNPKTPMHWIAVFLLFSFETCRRCSCWFIFAQVGNSNKTKLGKQVRHMYQWTPDLSILVKRFNIFFCVIRIFYRSQKIRCSQRWNFVTFPKREGVFSFNSQTFSNKTFLSKSFPGNNSFCKVNSPVHLKRVWFGLLVSFSILSDTI